MTKDAIEALNEGWTFFGLRVHDQDCFVDGRHCSGCGTQVVHGTDPEGLTREFILIGRRTLVRHDCAAFIPMQSAAK